MAVTDPIHALYAEHHARLRSQYETILEKASRDGAVIASGAPVPVAGDDQTFPFRVNPRFRQWVPEGDYSHSFVVVRPGRRPLLVCHQPSDYWHAVAPPPGGFWTDHFDIVCVPDPDQAVGALPQDDGKTAFLGDPSAAPEGWHPESVNPPEVVHPLDYHRVYKSDYEVACVRRASRIAAAGHLAAREAFRSGAAELEIHLAYLSASRQAERELPYPNIVALNEHAATLHHDRLDKDRPAESRTLLIDAGATHLGYAADVTRTWTTGDREFAALVEGLDAAQQSIVSRVAIGMSYVDLHLEAHGLVAGLLADAGLVEMSTEDMVEQGVTSVFLPHGLGHHLGLQVHDAGGKLADDRGRLLEQPQSHPFLRNLRLIEAGNVFTIEPGLYFIPQLLETLRRRPAGRSVDWDRVERLIPFGGVRIEDNVHVGRRGVENLTREAFLAMEG